MTYFQQRIPGFVMDDTHDKSQRFVTMSGKYIGDGDRTRPLVPMSEHAE